MQTIQRIQFARIFLVIFLINTFLNAVLANNDDQLHLPAELDGEDVTDSFQNMAHGNFSIGNTSTINSHSDTRKNEPQIIFRKCCPSKEFYNTNSHTCQIVADDFLEYYVHSTFPELEGNRIRTFSQKLRDCPNTSVSPTVESLNLENSLILLNSGQLFDNIYDHFYNNSLFCIELVGENIWSTNLMVVYCPREKAHVLSEEDPDSSKFAPKCCPDGQILNASDFTCSMPSDHVPADMHMSYKYLELKFFNDLHCVSYSPVKLDLEETFFSSNHLCLHQSKSCYSPNNYCIDNISSHVSQKIAFVCPEDFINKCCPNNQNLKEEGCSATNRQSVTLTHFLMSRKYKVKNVTPNVSGCTPILFEDDAKSDISWYIDDAQQRAVIIDKNNTFTTKNYCIDDFSDNESLFSVLKVCSEKARIHHAISSIENWSWLPNAIGKCCPLNKVFQESEGHPTCITHEIQSKAEHFESIQLLYTGIPTCSDDEAYLKYFLSNFTGEDYGKLTHEGYLSIIEISENKCKIKETSVGKESYCVDHLLKNDLFQPIAIVCVPKSYSRGLVNVILVGLSCTALISAFFVLVFTRVRRGMVTMRKMNTLAGKIILSYVTSLLIGYSALGVGVLADPKEQIGKCYIIVGFILFFSIAGFCWNTSICIEGLLLTLHVKMKETHRYLLHSLWAWGMSAIITVVALVMDANAKRFDCDTITPRIGHEICFFSDTMAAFLYFYLPISVTVVVNAIVLVAAKTLRKSKLKNLDKDPKHIRKQSLKQVMSIKNIRNLSRKKTTSDDFKIHSGLRTHQNKNMWVDTLKLVLWSGATWLTEILGTIYAIYRLKSQPDWYGYLFYIPVSFNTLRGVGISVIIILSSDNKSRMIRSYHTWKSQMSTLVRGNMILRRNQTTTCRKEPSTSSAESRRISVSTVVTRVPDASLSTVPENNDELYRREFRHSVSQVNCGNDSEVIAESINCFSETDNATNTITTATDV